MVSDEIVSPPQEAFQRELEYITAMTEYDKTFSELLDKIPVEENEVIQTINELRSMKPTWLLDPEKLRELGKGNPQLHRQVISYYQPFLEEKAGIKK